MRCHEISGKLEWLCHQDTHIKCVLKMTLDLNCMDMWNLVILQY